MRARVESEYSCTKKTRAHLLASAWSVRRGRRVLCCHLQQIYQLLGIILLVLEGCYMMEEREGGRKGGREGGRERGREGGREEG